MAAISSSTFKTRAGSGSITIDPNNDTALPSDTCTVSDLSSIKGDYDVENDDEEASAVYLSLGEMTVKVFDRLSDTNPSLFDEIDKITSTTDIPIELNFTLNSGRSFTELYYFKPSSVEYDRIRREVSIEAQPQLTSDPSVASIFTNNASDVYQIYFYGSDSDTSDQTVVTEDCMPISKFIDHASDVLNAGNTNIVDSPIFGNIGQTDGETSYVILDRGGGGRSSNTQLFRYAASEGAIVGSFLGYNFYTSRLDTTAKASISQSDVEDLNASIGLNSYLTIKNVARLGISQPIGYYSFATLIGDTDGLSDDASKRLDVGFRLEVTEQAQWDATNTRYQGFLDSPSGATTTEATTNEENAKGTLQINVSSGSGDTISAGDIITFGPPSDFSDKLRSTYVADSSVASGRFTIKTPLKESISSGVRVWKYNDVSVDTQSTNEIAQQGVDSYAKAYAATGERRIELTIFGLDTLKPYEVIEFDSSFDSPLNGAVYRPSTIEYNFVTDKIKVEAYQIV